MATSLGTPPYNPAHLPTILCSNRAIISGEETPATIIISRVTGKILDIRRSVLAPSAFPVGTLYHDYSPKVLMAGLVDAHVHLNEPGWRTEWEGFETGTLAAAFGGVTTLIDMPLNAIPPTTTLENLELKVDAARGQCWVDIGFYGGVIPGNEEDLVPLVKAGVRGFKCFLIESGVEEFPAVGVSDVAIAMEKLKDSPTVLMFHAEMHSPLTLSHDGPPFVPPGPRDAYSTFLASRPRAFETHAIGEILSLAHIAPSLQLHVVHLSATEGIPLVRAAQSSGIKVSAETCFHYLTLAAEDVDDGDTRYKCCPPIREGSNRDGLWDALKEGLIETVVSDHSPCTAGLKRLKRDGSDGDFFKAWGGISTVGLGLSILWTEGRKRGVSLAEISSWTSYKTAKQVGLLGRKGNLEVGWDADILVFDPETEFTVTTADMRFKNKVTPYENKSLKGKVCETWLRGRRIYSALDGFDEKIGASGIMLLEPRTHTT